MKEHLTDQIARTVSAKGCTRDLLVYDDDVAGLALRVTLKGARSFVLLYRINGRKRSYTLGSWPDWSAKAAREEAKALKRQIDSGIDPLGTRNSARDAPTFSQLIERYLTEHCAVLAPRSASDHASILHKMVEPEWGTRKVADIQPEDVDHLLNKIAKGRPRPRKHPPNVTPRKPQMKPYSKPTPTRANRVGEIVRKMFNLAIRWRMRPDNPAIGFMRRPEVPRDRYLTNDEIKRLTEVSCQPSEQAVRQHYPFDPINGLPTRRGHERPLGSVRS